MRAPAREIPFSHVRCTAVFPIPSLGLQWLIDGSEIEGETSPSLRIPGFAEDMQGVFSVRVQNEGASVLSRGIHVTAAGERPTIALTCASSLDARFGAYVPQSPTTLSSSPRPSPESCFDKESLLVRCLFTACAHNPIVLHDCSPLPPAALSPSAPPRRGYRPPSCSGARTGAPFQGPTPPGTSFVPWRTRPRAATPARQPTPPAPRRHCLWWCPSALSPP
jgi:hypothetical protein